MRKTRNKALGFSSMTVRGKSKGIFFAQRTLENTIQIINIYKPTTAKSISGYHGRTSNRKLYNHMRFPLHKTMIRISNLLNEKLCK